MIIEIDQDLRRQNMAVAFYPCRADAILSGVRYTCHGSTGMCHSEPSKAVADDAFMPGLASARLPVTSPGLFVKWGGQSASHSKPSKQTAEPCGRVLILRTECVSRCLSKIFRGKSCGIPQSNDCGQKEPAGSWRWASELNVRCALNVGDPAQTHPDLAQWVRPTLRPSDRARNVCTGISPPRERREGRVPLPPRFKISNLTCVNGTSQSQIHT